MRLVKMILLSVSLLMIAFSQTERWVYRYNGFGNDDDKAYSLVYGIDGNIYTAGESYDSTFFDFTVISLTSNGSERWVYRYNGSGNGWDEANSLVYGTDGNIYVAGYSTGSGTYSDFTVISLTSNGSERWVYCYNGLGNDDDEANSLVYGTDGNIYVAGYSTGSGTYSDFTVISLTSNGSERWVYRYNGPGNGHDWAYSFVYGADDNIYVAGRSWGSGTNWEFTVISLAADGSERWVYRYNGPGNYEDWAYSLVYGTDGNIYTAGESYVSGAGRDFTVISLAANGSERWVYSYNGPGNGWDEAYSLVYGTDDNIYVAGYSESSGTYRDFTVISLTSNGSERWVYRYNGPGNGWDWAYSLVYGTDDNIYTGGWSYSRGISTDFTVISLTSNGSERWVYRYNGSGNSGDGTYSLVYGTDGIIYAAGYSTGSNTWRDFTVISLNPAIGIDEQNPILIDKGFNFSVATSQNQSLSYSLFVSEPSTILLSLYNLSGQKILSWQISASQGTSHYEKYLPNLSQGVYFLKAAVLGKGFRDCKKLIVIK